MSEQALDLRKSLQIVRRHKIIVGVAALLGLLAGVGYTLLSPPMLASSALVVLPVSNHDMATQVVIAGSDSVLSRALHSVRPAMSLQTLRSRVQVKSLTANVMSIDAEGKTAAQAEGTANAVARSYVAYLSSKNSPSGRVQGVRLLESATNATGTSLTKSLLVNGGLGALLGGLIGTIGALALSRGDRRLRQRDEMADAIGVPVLASIPVEHPSDAGSWARLLENYEPGVVHAWSLRKALRYLALTDYQGGSGGSVTVLSLSSDHRALALGPQLAAFAASLGIPTALVIGSQQDPNATATLTAACAARSPTVSGRSSLLRVAAGERTNADRPPGVGLTVVVAVVDGRAPRLDDMISTTTTVLGVSAGAATAEQLARVAVAAAAAGEGREIAGIVVADPDPADHTTGRLPQLARPTRGRLPTRLTGTSTETRR
jgi:capsular polysaccharide biosynthesis protein